VDGFQIDRNPGPGSRSSAMRPDASHDETALTSARDYGISSGCYESFHESVVAVSAHERTLPVCPAPHD
jgi:hypothetical protein